MKTTRVTRQRRHTLYFLGELGALAPVFLDTEVDMSEVYRHRALADSDELRYSTASYVLHASARALAIYPEANVALRGRRSPRVAHFDAVHGKLALDKTVDGQRVVASAVLHDLDRASLDHVQRLVDHYRNGSPETMAEFAGMRLLHRLPGPLGRLMFRMGVRPLSRRADVMGTFAVTSLGHRPVDGFHSLGGTTITLGVGQVADRPVVRDGAISIAPMMRLSMAFDHRAIDGALAADLLAEVKRRLEAFPVDPEQSSVNGHRTPGKSTEGAGR